MQLTKSVKNATILKKIFEFNPGIIQFANNKTIKTAADNISIIHRKKQS